MGEIEQPRPTSVIRPIRAAMTKDIEKNVWSNNKKKWRTKKYVVRSTCEIDLLDNESRTKENN